MLRLEVDLDILRANLAALSRLTKSGICAVVKADAYGHGIEAVRAFDAADEFAVSSIGEALELSAFTDKPVNVLSLPDKTVREQYRSGIYPSVASADDMEFVSEYGADAVNLKLNTGMNRYGMSPSELESALKNAQKCGLAVKSVFSHIYDVSVASKQFELFDKCVKPFVDYIPQKHILSGNFTVLPEYMHLDMVRVGLVLYGYGHEAVKPAATVKCSITQLRDVQADENVGYGIAVSGMHRKIAVLGAGYADGFRRISGSSPRYVSVGGNLCRVVGQVCMDACMADVTGLDAAVGDEVCLIGEGVSAQSYAASCDTIVYEILTGFGKRTKRVYTQSEV